MSVSPQAIRELRNRTQAGFMDCKSALVEADGNIDEAIQIIRKKGMASAVKRAGRSAQEGKLCVAHSNSGAIVVFELNSETDFVTRNELFQKASSCLSKTIEDAMNNGNNDLTLESALALKVEDAPEAEWTGKSIQEMVQQLSGTIGEKIEISRVNYLAARENETLESYIHAGDRLVSVVGISGTSDNLSSVAKDVAMHVAASSPLYLTHEEVPAAALENEKSIYLEQAMSSGKPKEIAEKIVMGKLKNYYKQVCLIDQPFIKEPKKTVSQYLQECGDGGAQITRFLRMSCGEQTQ